MATIQVGTDIRHWVTYEVKDLTAEEAEILAEDDERALELARKMQADNRLVDMDWEEDDNPTIFAKEDNPSIISVNTEEPSCVSSD